MSKRAELRRMRRAHVVNLTALHSSGASRRERREQLRRATPKRNPTLRAYRRQIFGRWRKHRAR